ncbi:MAG TPA: type I-B CRISPR-associated protein Cas8b/Csh1 [Syntrophomonadaceae bacterium]|nr:type I-B CRISPR-associated protein Cas8b/Csh1 [Syntrophomonadaceae bacterium]
MLEAVALIGRKLAEDYSVADLIKTVKKPADVERIYLVKLNFQTGGGKPLTVEMQEIDRSALLQYRWVGHEKGNRPQICLTSGRLDYLVGQVPENLLERLEVGGLENGSLHRRLSRLVALFYRKLPDGTRVLDPQRLELTDEDLITALWEQETGKPQDPAKEVISGVAGFLEKWALKQLGLKAKEAALWTILLDGEPLAADPDYDRILLSGKDAAVDSRERGVCSVCGATDRPVTTDFTRLNFLKYYITDKLGAASGLEEEGFARNFQACEECFRGLSLAEKFVQDGLSLRVGRLSFLVLPAFLKEPELSRDDLLAWVESLKVRVGAFTDFAGWLEKIGGRSGLERELQYLLEGLPYANAALLNFLFYSYSEGRSEFRILSLIKDVAPGRISRFLRRSHRIAAMAEEVLGQARWWLDLTAIYRLIPLNEGPRRVEYKKLLHVYQSLLTGEPIERTWLIREFVSLVRIFQAGGYAGTNVSQPKAGNEELEWTQRLLQANLLLKFLDEEELLRGGMPLSAPLREETEVLPEGMRNYLEAMAYNEPQTALFLLGYLLHQVGQKQYERGYESKPVLEKVNYAGMPWPKVVRLANLLVDQLRQHDILKYCEGLFAVMKGLFDAYRPGAHQQEWPLSPEENVFYILSGYAYGTRMALKAWAEREKAKAQDEQEGDAER